jgi:tetratricopeptide (TPR) repeat protein
MTVLAFFSILQCIRAQQPEQSPQKWVEDALRYVQSQEPKKAIAALETAIKIDPQNFPAHTLLGQILLDAGQPGRALPHLETAARLRPNDSPTVFSLGVAQLESGRNAEAFETLAKLAAREPNEIATKAYLTRAALRLKKTTVARTTLAALRKLAPDDGLLHAQLVEYCFPEQANEITREQIQFTLGLQLPEAQRARIYYLLAMLDQHSRQTRRALDEFARALQLDSSREEYFAALVTLQGSTGVEKVDREILNQGLERFPDSRDLLITQALGEMHAGQITESFQTAKRVLEKHPQAGEGYVLLGRLELTNLAYDRALAALRRALELRATDPTVHYYLGICLRRLSNDAEAADHFARAVALDPAYADAWLEYGRLLRDLGRYEKATDAFRTAIRLSPKLVIAYNLMSQTLRKMGRQEEAVKYLARFKEMSQKE